MVTITEVAKKAGVSPTTASYALNGRTEVKEETRKRILEVARELHYVPNRLAQSFRNGKTNTIVVLTNEAIESENTFTGEFFGILAEARANHYDVLVKLVDDRDSSAEQIHTIFKERVSDGFLLLGNLSKEYLQCFLESGNFGVLLSAHTELPIVQVNCNGYKGIFDLTKMILSMGKVNPVYLAYSNVTIEEKLRREGFLNAIDTEIMDGKEHVYACGISQNEIEECVNNCIQKGADCFVCWNDILAYNVLDILGKKGFKVPEEVAVTGFDDIPPTAREKILTTVHQPFFEKGRKAMQLLLAQINGETLEQEKYLIDCNIVARKSL